MVMDKCHARMSFHPLFKQLWLEGLKSGLQTTLVMFSVTDGSREISTEIMFENTLILQLNIQDKKVSFSNLGLGHPHDQNSHKSCGPT